MRRRAISHNAIAATALSADEFAGYDGASHKLLTANRERYLWQSVLGLARPPDLCDLGALARSLGADVAYQQAWADTQGDGFGTGIVRMTADGFERIPPSEWRK